MIQENQKKPPKLLFIYFDKNRELRAIYNKLDFSNVYELIDEEDEEEETKAELNFTNPLPDFYIRNEKGYIVKTKETREKLDFLYEYSAKLNYYLHYGDFSIYRIQEVEKYLQDKYIDFLNISKEERLKEYQQFNKELNMALEGKIYFGIDNILQVLNSKYTTLINIRNQILENKYKISDFITLEINDEEISVKFGDYRDFLPYSNDILEKIYKDFYELIELYVVFIPAELYYSFEVYECNMSYIYLRDICFVDYYQRHMEGRMDKKKEKYANYVSDRNMYRADKKYDSMLDLVKRYPALEEMLPKRYFFPKSKDSDEFPMH